MDPSNTNKDPSTNKKDPSSTGTQVPTCTLKYSDVPTARDLEGVWFKACSCVLLFLLRKYEVPSSQIRHTVSLNPSNSLVYFTFLAILVNIKCPPCIIKPFLSVFYPNWFGLWQSNEEHEVLWLFSAMLRPKLHFQWSLWLVKVYVAVKLSEYSKTVCFQWWFEIVWTIYKSLQNKHFDNLNVMPCIGLWRHPYKFYFQRYWQQVSQILELWPRHCCLNLWNEWWVLACQTIFTLSSFSGSGKAIWQKVSLRKFWQFSRFRFVPAKVDGACLSPQLPGAGFQNRNRQLESRGQDSGISCRCPLLNLMWAQVGDQCRLS